jgi:hypothetical protein
MIERPSVEIALVFGSDMTGAVVLSAPVSAVEVCLVWAMHFKYQPFASQYALFVGAACRCGVGRCSAPRVLLEQASQPIVSGQGCHSGLMCPSGLSN